MNFADYTKEIEKLVLARQKVCPHDDITYHRAHTDKELKDSWGADWWDFKGAYIECRSCGLAGSTKNPDTVDNYNKLYPIYEKHERDKMSYIRGGRS